MLSEGTTKIREASSARYATAMFRFPAESRVGSTGGSTTRSGAGRTPRPGGPRKGGGVPRERGPEVEPAPALPPTGSRLSVRKAGLAPAPAAPPTRPRARGLQARLCCFVGRPGAATAPFPPTSTRGYSSAAPATSMAPSPSDATSLCPRSSGAGVALPAVRLLTNHARSAFNLSDRGEKGWLTGPEAAEALAAVLGPAEGGALGEALLRLGEPAPGGGVGVPRDIFVGFVVRTVSSMNPPRRAAHVFRSYDSNRDGLLPLADAAQALRDVAGCFGGFLTQKEAGALVAARAKGGAVTIKTFLATVSDSMHRPSVLSSVRGPGHARGHRRAGQRPGAVLSHGGP